MPTKVLRGRKRRWEFAKKLVGILPLEWKRQLLYLKHFRRWANLNQPIRFSEKMQWRIIYDRSEQLAIACDKLRTYEHARSVASQAGLQIHTPHVLGFSAEADTFIAELKRRQINGELPSRFVIKPNHGSGQVLLVDGVPDWPETAAQVRAWISRTEYSGLHWIWGYSRARPGLIAEEYIGGTEEPVEWQVWMFNGEPAAYLLKQRNQAGFARANYDSEWRRLPPWNNTDRDWLEVTVPPKLAPRVLNIARVLSAGWSHLRVDLYVDSSNRIWIGELTPYSQEGLLRVSKDADDFDRRLGELWRLP